MVKGPAVIIVVRHGARLDAANRDWHLTAPEPYNPPLTYGGWNQSRALGARIASLLRLREDGLLDSDDLKEKLTGYAADGQSVAVSTNGTGKEKRCKKQHKIVIHSSPYVRCVQTSIAISAGIASTKKAARKRSTVGQLADLSLSTDPMNMSVRDYASSPLDERPDAAPGRPTLRIDALLGEWQNPEYFEGMTAPPNSATMVVGAKAELLRRGEPVEVGTGISINRGNFPGGWSSSVNRSNTPAAARAPPYHSTAGSLPIDVSSRDGTRSRSGSVSSSESSNSRSSRSSSSTKKRAAAYVPPVPRYAIAPSDPIPKGFVAHARDACVNTDFQWDSMRPPQEWGDGGELGEEWGAMHKRIRNGFQKMIKWYRVHEVDTSLDEQPLAYPENDSSTLADGENDDDEDDLVLVLVTHGAGCNALIGALTNQPVLLDVGMASLTMAVRKETARRPSAPDRSQTFHSEVDLMKRRRSSVDFGLSRDYEMKLIASTEHLRAAADPGRARASRPNDISVSNGNSDMGLASPDSVGRTTSAALGSVRRSNTSSGVSRPVSRRYASPSPERPRTTSRAGTTSTTGLWSRTPTTQATTPATLPDTLSELSDSPTEAAFTLGAAMHPAEPLEKPVDRVRFDVDGLEEEEEEPGPLPVAVVKSGSQGLWGANVARGAPPRRRWTVDQQG